MKCEGYADTARTAYLVERLYSRVYLNGGAKRAFSNALDRLASIKGIKIVLFAAPIAPMTKSMIAQTGKAGAENKFVEIVKGACAKYPNVTFVDFFSSGIKELSDSCYYDANHLNDNGATIFTSILCDSLGKIILTP